MSWYATAKAVHVVCVVLSIAGFVTRFALAWRGSTLLRRPAARILPHVNDTMLLGAAIAMLALARIDPLAVPWLSAKVAGLVVYILLGMVALRHGRTPAIRTVAFAAALGSFGYLVSVALVKNPLGILTWLAA
ncbi:MAG: hypothetical protein EHM59_00410 [Betaproteobacteria bacterium]|nr:MAG: hypothetical protein EHM59_00410 [Betaproteobacteria bacterium]